MCRWERGRRRRNPLLVTVLDLQQSAETFIKKYQQDEPIEKDPHDVLSPWRDTKNEVIHDRWDNKKVQDKP